MKIATKLLDTILSYIFYYGGTYWLYKKKALNSRHIPIIFYHEISNSGQGWTEGLSVSSEIFEQQIKWISENYNIVHVDDLVKHINGEIRLPGRLAAITFDGGYLGNYKYAFSILKKYNVPSTVYVITDSIDDKLSWERTLLYLILLTKKKHFSLEYNSRCLRYNLNTLKEKRSAKHKLQGIMSSMGIEHREKFLEQISKELDISLKGLAHKLFLTWDQIREMNNSPLITIGSHSLTHPRLTEIPKQDAEREIIESKPKIEHEIGEEIQSFCYPDGFYSREIIEIVKKAGYTSALSVTTPFISNNLCKVSDDVFEIPRIFMPNRFNVPIIAAELSGILRSYKNIFKFFLKLK